MPETKKSTTKPASAKKAKKAKLDVPTLTDVEKKVVMIQYGKEHDLDGADALVAEYLKFMQIKIGEKGSDECCAPSKRIDEMWHAHILSTREYLAFCDRHNGGEYLHHDPTMTSVPARYRATMKRYLELFEEKPKDQGIWPPIEEEEEEYLSSEDYDDYDDLGCG